MSIGEICTRDVVVANRDDSILDVAKLMRRYHVGDVVVVDRDGDRNLPVGIVTDRDIVLAVVAKEADVKSVTAVDIMSEDLLLAREEDQCAGLVPQMRTKGVRRVPVISRDGELVGIVCEDDIIDSISEQLAELAFLVKRGGQREQKKRA